MKDGVGSLFIASGMDCPVHSAASLNHCLGALYKWHRFVCASDTGTVRRY